MLIKSKILQRKIDYLQMLLHDPLQLELQEILTIDIDWQDIHSDPTLVMETLICMTLWKCNNYEEYDP